MQIDLILGYNGFLASNFYKFLKKKKNKIYLVGKKKIKKKNYFQLRTKKSLNLVLEKIQPTRIWNFVGAYKSSEEKIFDSNYFFTKELLNTKYVICNNPKILLIGSAAEYGFYKEKFSENDYLEPRSIYGFSKAMQSIYFKYHFLRHQSKIILVRLFNVVGPQMPAKLFLGKVFKDFSNKKTITINNCDSERDYIDIKKTCCGLYKIIKKGKHGEIYNFGSGKPTKNIDILKKIIRKRKIKTKKKIIELKSLNKNKIFADIKKFRNL